MSATDQLTGVRWDRRVFSFIQRRNISAILAVAIVVAGVFLGSFTYLILTGATPFTPDDGVVLILLILNLAVVLTLCALIFWRVGRIILARRSGIAGAKLHARLVTMFSVVAVMPAIIVAVFATVTLNRGLDIWFGERTREIIGNSLEVAESYLEEHSQVLRSEVTLMANDLSREATSLSTSPQRFQKLLATQAALRALNAAYIISREGKILSRATASVAPSLNLPTDEQFEQAEEGQVVLFTVRDGNQIRALLELPGVNGAYLYAARFIDSRVLDHLTRTQAAVSEYKSLQGRQKGVQVTFALIYIAVALVVLLAAIWLGLWAANRIVEPLGRLMGAAERVRTGDLSTRVEEAGDDDEIDRLSRAFNRMTSQIEEQRNDLISANHEMDERRRFTEAVLAGVSAGVIGLDAEGRINHANKAAQRFLGGSFEAFYGKPLVEVLPAMAQVVAAASGAKKKSAQEQLSLSVGGQDRTLNVRVAGELSGDDIEGYVITFDDITELVLAQRNAAWADVARRIAHEIKNPLTPIQLSAERLRRKYAKEITTDPDVFEQCTETIVRQVNDIGRMVDEFSSFARMPSAVMRETDLGEVVRQSVFLQRVAHTEIQYEFEPPSAPVQVEADGRLISQALTNILKNAFEAVRAHHEQETGRSEVEPGEKIGKISARVEVSGQEAVVTITDTGCGLPKESRQRLTEPYVTTREKGTGLGLAIVKKVMEDHNGILEMRDAPESADGKTGAQVLLRFPLPSHGQSRGLESNVGESRAAQEEARVLTTEEKEAANGV
ncbi:multi-sensor signal transduction histidine kinase [Tepidicaulis marinus]|uniref:histidine kinase n=1 Tax=Tepidicaulis marinus TaxID=1333998 RepID=A0A081B8W4_9HYPH|nr:PAS domain-containing sensor histidine kinase [Tepidicaulis marinus]GAK44482.1 multi-sensor signal transduction histidine kinase [Tepidicaulis marinus]